MKSTLVGYVRSMVDRAPADRRERQRNRRRDFTGRILEALEARELLAHIPGTVQFDEHAAAFGEAPDPTAPHVLIGGLVPDGSVTIKSVAPLVPDPNHPVPLNWSDPNSWIVVDPAHHPSPVPTLNDNVLISSGTKVTFDSKADLSNPLHTIRVDGTLAFDPTVSTKLLVDTIVVEPWGTYQEGTAASPIKAGVKDDVVFTGGPIDTSWDPYQFSRGLITHGAVSIYGQQVTSEVAALPNNADGSTSLIAGTRTIVLSSAPTGWNAGDRLVITGDTAASTSGYNQDEQVAIKSIVTDGNGKTTLTINDDPINPTNGAALKTPKGLSVEHDAPSGSFIYIADVTRNAVFESQNPAVVAQRGHLMFMHNGNVNLSGVGVYGLGRTDKRNPIDDPNPVPDTLAINAYAANASYTLPADDFWYTTFDDASGTSMTTIMTNDVLDSKTGQRVMVPVVDANGKPVQATDPKTSKLLTNPDGTPQYVLQVAKSGLNPRGRYAIHFHRTGTDPGSAMATVYDSAVVDSPGWGIVNHSSNVDVEGNVVFNALGAAYVTEAGDEAGKFVGNIAIHSQGGNSGSIEDPRFGFGQLGDGFWLQGGNVSLSNNIATGMHHSGYVFFPRGLDQAGLGVTQIALTSLDPAVRQALIDTSSAVQSQIAANTTAVAKGLKATPVMVPDGQVPLRLFDKNVAAASGDGLETWFSLLDFSDAKLATIAADTSASLQTVISNFTAWDTGGNGIFSPYTNHIAYQNVTLLRGITSLSNPNGTGFARNDVTANATFFNVNVQGYLVGINVPVNGTNLIQGGTFDDGKDILITTSNENRVVSIDDKPGSPSVPINFKDDLGAAVLTKLGLATQYHVFLQASFDPKDADITKIFSKDVVQMGKVMQGGKQLFYFEQDANYVPFPKAGATSPDGSASPPAAAPNFVVPAELLGLTNRQLYTKYGFAVGGIVAPDGASASDKHINALIGDLQTYLPNLQLVSRKYTNFPDPNDKSNPVAQLAKPYTLVYKFYDPQYVDPNAATSKKPIKPDSSGYVTIQVVTPLHAGWNVIVVDTDGSGQKRAVLVYGDNTPPTFTLAASTPTTLNQADIDNGSSILIQGRIGDDSLGTTTRDFRQTFKFNDPAKPAATDPFTYTFVNGKITSATLKFFIYDFAGNKYQVSITFAVTDTSTLVKDIDRKNLPTIKVSVTLVALLATDGISPPGSATTGSTPIVIKP